MLTETVAKKKKNVTVDGKKVTLCGGSGCCPTVENVDDTYVLKDDFGGKVMLTTEQFEAMIEHYAGKGASL